MRPPIHCDGSGPRVILGSDDRHRWVSVGKDREPTWGYGAAEAGAAAWHAESCQACRDRDNVWMQDWRRVAIPQSCCRLWQSGGVCSGLDWFERGGAWVEEAPIVDSVKQLLQQSCVSLTRCTAKRGDASRNRRLLIRRVEKGQESIAELQCTRSLST